MIEDGNPSESTLGAGTTTDEPVQDGVSAPIGYEADGPVAVITLPERVGANSVLALRSRSERALVSGSRAIAIDLRATRHIDTPTLCELSVALHRLSHHHPKLAVVGADSRVRWVLELCEIEGLQQYPTMRGALAHVHPRRRLSAVISWRHGLRRTRPALRRPAEP